MKLFVKLWNIVTTVLVTAAVLLALALAGVRLVGLTPYVVLSGSISASRWSPPGSMKLRMNPWRRAPAWTI